MATITGVNIYIDGVKHNSTPQPLTQTTYDISNVKAEGAAFNVQFSYVYDDGTESQLTAIQSYSLATTVIQLQEIVFDTNTISLGAVDYSIQSDNIVSQLYYNYILNSNGKTTLALKESSTDNIILSEISQYGIRPPSKNRGTVSGDTNYHDYPVLKWEGNRLLIVQENRHGNLPTAYHKATVDNDSLVIDNEIGLLGGIVGDANSDVVYPIVITRGEKTYLIGRYDSVLRGPYSSGYKVSNSIEGVWSNVFRLAFPNSSENEDRKYQSAPFNPQFSNDIIIMSMGRNDTSNTWFNYYLLRLRPNDVNNNFDIYTFDGTFIVNGGVDNTEEQALKIATTGTSTITGYQCVWDLDSSENYYGIIKLSGDYVLLKQSPTSGSTVTQTIINFPDAPALNDESQTHAVRYIQPISESNLNIFVAVNNTIRDIIRQYKSTDGGTTWVVIQDIDFGVNVVSFQLTGNYNIVGNNTNILAVAQAAQPDINLPATFLMKKAAFGAIQTNQNIYDTRPLLSESVFNSSSILSYFIESDKITNTATTLNTVIDQSVNANNITALGSPVIDNSTTPTEVTFDGVDDALPLNPALLQANKNYLILAVIDANGNDVGAITMSNNTVSSEFMIPQIRSAVDFRIGHITRVEPVTIGIVNGDTPIGAGFHIYAWLYKGTNSGVAMWYDGNMEMRETNSVIQPSSKSYEGSLTLPSGVTNMEIGRLVRDTSLYYNLKMKHISMHEVNSESEILDRIKFLGNKYGITLQNAYR